MNHESQSQQGEWDGFDEDAKYDEFPRGDENGFGPARGFNRWVRINDPDLFTDEARQDPVNRQFLNAPYSINYAQFKSSHRESEYFVHKPDRAMRGEVEGIEGTVQGMPGVPRIATLIVNHERSLARRITRSVTIEDGDVAGQLIHKGAIDEPELEA